MEWPFICTAEAFAGSCRPIWTSMRWPRRRTWAPCMRQGAWTAMPSGINAIRPSYTRRQSRKRRGRGGCFGEASVENPVTGTFAEALCPHDLVARKYWWHVRRQGVLVARAPQTCSPAMSFTSMKGRRITRSGWYPDSALFMAKLGSFVLEWRVGEVAESREEDAGPEGNVNKSHVRLRIWGIEKTLFFLSKNTLPSVHTTFLSIQYRSYFRLRFWAIKMPGAFGVPSKWFPGGFSNSCVLSWLQMLKHVGHFDFTLFTHIDATRGFTSALGLPRENSSLNKELLYPDRGTTVVESPSNISSAAHFRRPATDPTRCARSVASRSHPVY